MTWFTETLYGGLRQSIAIREHLYGADSGRQRIDIFETALFGRMLTLDGAVQLTQLDCHVYHELFAHVPIVAHGAVSDVLIIGGGDGGLLREALKHAVQSVTLVEIDREVIALSREFFPDVCGSAFDDPRLELVIADAADFMRRETRRFDLILIDSTDPVGVGAAVFTRAFYLNCRSRLRRDGAIVAQGGAPLFRPAPQDDAFRSVFGPSQDFVAPVPSYPTGLLMLRAAALEDWSLDPPVVLTRKRLQRSRLETRHYSADTHRGAFELLPAAYPRAAWPIPAAAD